ncbi:hypothetical protein [Crenalkalicoccus roseus]|uniref:hypothetical protein n=1 Tax=Crenalkalicoccus roseus TaxID=1485588 RepID=UPI0010816202|nr:hypothetical protein [Crenalkalicoccus roseus]
MANMKIFSGISPPPLLARLLRPTRSEEPAALRAFLRRQAAFVAQKTVLDYCRVKAGRQEQRVMADPDFRAALRHCRWQVFLPALADVTALIEAWLRPHAEGREPVLAAALVRLHVEALAAEPVPPEEVEAAEAALRALPGHLAALQLEPPWPAHRLPLLAEAPLFATLPVHPDQRRGEAPAIRGALRFHIVSTQQEMERAFAPAALAGRLLATAAVPEPAG